MSRDTTTQTIDLIVEQLGGPGGPVQLRKDGRAPGLVVHYSAPLDAPPEHGNGYTQLYWSPADSVWISWTELERIERLAEGEREPFRAQVATVPPVPGLRPCSSQVHTDWARTLWDTEFYRPLPQAAARQ
jgi:hypothetical protein